jgi:hypothetical protein
MPRENDVEKLRIAHKASASDLARAVADMVWRSEQEPVMARSGKWVLDDTGVGYLLHRSGRTYPISERSGAFANHMAYEYGLAASEPLTRVVVDRLRGRAAHESSPVPTARFAYWDRQKKFLCLSLYNGKYIKLSGTGVPATSNPTDPRNQGVNGIATEENGTSVMFLDDDGGTQLNESDIRRGFGEAARNPKLYETLTGSMSLADSLGGDPGLQKKLFFLWVLSCCFPQRFTSKPIAVMVGEMGGGKTSAVQAAQIILKGAETTHIVQKSDEPHFWIKLLRSPICLLDNLDNFFPWLEDLFCAYATQGSWERKKLYADTDRVVIRPQSFLAATTKIPSNFSRVDVADRSLFFAFKRHEGFSESWKQQLHDDRPSLFAELVVLLNRIVDCLKDYKPRSVRYRMSEFANFCYAAAPVLGWADEEIDRMLAMAEGSRQLVSGATDPLMSIVISAVKSHPDKVLMGTAADIVDKWLGAETQARGKPLPDARDVGRLLTSIWRGAHGPLKVDAAPAHGNVHRYTVTLREKRSENVDSQPVQG